MIAEGIGRALRCLAEERAQAKDAEHTSGQLDSSLIAQLAEREVERALREALDIPTEAYVAPAAVEAAKTHCESAVS